MLSDYRSAGLRGLSLLLMVVVAGCADSQGGRSAQQALAPDPQLQASPIPIGQPIATKTSSELPPDFPREIPLYPEATVQQVTALSGGSPTAASSEQVASQPGVLTRWKTPDSSEKVRRFYTSQFQDNSWRLMGSSTDQAIVAQREGLLVTVTVSASPLDGTVPQNPDSASTGTEFLIEYSRVPGAIADSTPSDTSGGSSQLGSSASSTSNPSALPPASPQPDASGGGTIAQSQLFSDLDKVPPTLRKAVDDLAALGVLQPSAADTKTATSSTPRAFEPGKAVTRRDYARWLITANNRLHGDRPAQQIRLGTETSQPSFQDIPRTDPDFAAIQGLAEAGIIPSPLIGQGSALFRPNDPLTREQLLLWKVPLDTRQALPAPNIEVIKQTWGFQDAAQIEPRASRAVLADFQNGDLATIRRVFGYTTLFQPKKAVTRAEAAASLWYFGSQTEGISAEQALTPQP